MLFYVRLIKYIIEETEPTRCTIIGSEACLVKDGDYIFTEQSNNADTYRSATGILDVGQFH